MSSHETLCPNKPIQCEYCTNLIKSNDYGEHIYMCGNKI
jgi:hypothetical protein